MGGFSILASWVDHRCSYRHYSIRSSLLVIVAATRDSVRRGALVLAERAQATHSTHQPSAFFALLSLFAGFRC